MTERVPVPLRTRLAFGLGQLAEGTKNTAFNLFLLFFYSQVLGLPGTLAGFALFLATAFDAVTDPLVGSLSDRLRHRWGRRHPFLYAAALPLGVSFTLLFRPPAGLGEGALFAWLLCFTIAVRASMTLFHVPHLALGAELSDDYEERTLIAATRTAFSLTGVVGVVAGAWLVFFAPSAEHPVGQLNAAAYPAFGLCFGAVMAVTVLLSAWGTHDQIPRLPQPARDIARFSARQFWSDYRRAFSNASFRAFCLGITVFYVMRGLQEVLGVHMFTYFWRLDADEIFAIGAAALPGLLVGVPFWTWAARRYDKRPAFLIGVAGFSACVLGPPVARIVGFFPEPESAVYLAILIATAVGAAFGASAGLVLAGSMMADVADEHELTHGVRQEGIFFAALSFAAKSTSGLGTFLGGVGLDWIEFPTQAAPEDVSEATSLALGILYGPGIGVLAVIALVFLARYRLDRARHREIRALLDQRNTRPTSA
ncbi:MAG: MFS transporter [Myxococcota bacterium]